MWDLITPFSYERDHYIQATEAELRSWFDSSRIVLTQKINGSYVDLGIPRTHENLKKLDDIEKIS